MAMDDLLRRGDVIEALGEEPEDWGGWDIDRGFNIQWNEDVNAITNMPCLSFKLFELTEQKLRGLHGDMVIVAAPDIPELDNKIVPCLGVHKDLDGHEYIVLDGEEWSLDMVTGGFIRLFTVTS